MLLVEGRRYLRREEQPTPMPLPAKIVLITNNDNTIKTEKGGEKTENGIRKRLREGGILLLPLKLPGFGGEVLPRSFGAHTNAHEYDYSEEDLPFHLSHPPILPFLGS